MARTVLGDLAKIHSALEELASTAIDDCAKIMATLSIMHRDADVVWDGEEGETLRELEGDAAQIFFLSLYIQKEQIQLDIFTKYVAMCKKHQHAIGALNAYCVATGVERPLQLR